MLAFSQTQALSHGFEYNKTFLKMVVKPPVSVTGKERLSVKGTLP
jgi:hypothetical protein